MNFTPLHHQLIKGPPDTWQAIEGHDSDKIKEEEALLLSLGHAVEVTPQKMEKKPFDYFKLIVPPLMCLMIALFFWLAMTIINIYNPNFVSPNIFISFIIGLLSYFILVPIIILVVTFIGTVICLPIGLLYMKYMRKPAL